MTDVRVSTLPAAPLHVFEIFASPGAVAERFQTAFGFALPAKGRAGGTERMRLLRYEPTVWLVEGEAGALAKVLGDDGALTDIGGGVVRVRLFGRGWRALLMEGGVFDAESAAFVPGCTAATIIDHVAVRLHVVNDDICDAYVPASYAEGLLKFWNAAAVTLVR